MHKDIITIGLIGCGEHSREVILPILLLYPGIHVVTLCDDSTDRLERAHTICPDADRVMSYESVCKDSAIDAVVIVATPQVHVAAGILALQNNKHVFVEKPLAGTASEARRIENLASKSTCVTMVGHNFRFAPAFDRVKMVMADEQFGQPALIQLGYMASKPRGVRWSIESPERSMLLSHGSHALDIMIDLVGSDLKVTNAELSQFNESLFGTIMLMASSGCLCSISITNGAPHFDIDVTVAGSNDSLIQMRSLREVRSFADPEHFKRIGHIWVPPTLASGFGLSGYWGEIDAFIKSIRECCKAPVAFSDGARVVELIEDVLEIVENKSIQNQ